MTTTNTATSTAATLPALIVGTENLRKEFQSIAAAGKKLDGRIQIAGLSVLDHIEKHSDVTVATSLVNELFGSLSKGHRKQAMAHWLTKYGKIRINQDDTTKKAQPFLFDKSAKTDLQGAMAEPWYDCKQDEEIKDLDFLKLLISLIHRATKEGAHVLPGQEELVEKAKLLIPMAHQPAIQPHAAPVHH
jgi:hypothetical protein